MNDGRDGDRVIAAELTDSDAVDVALRPRTLDDFVGQKQLRENLRVFINAARARG